MQAANTSLVDKLYQLFLSEKTKAKSEHIITLIAIGSFLLHLLIILLCRIGVLDLQNYSALLGNPIGAIYTPFSFILVYEVYLLIYNLPRSITTYIGKQYEIMTLIVIRRVFKDLSHLELSSNWFGIKNDLQFTFDIIASVVLFSLIFIFMRLSKRSQQNIISEQPTPALSRFLRFKKIVALSLVPLLLIVGSYSFVNWTIENFFTVQAVGVSLTNINNIFFDTFFTILILVDVLLLLFSLRHTDQFHKVFRNSGFIISTILIRLSFGVEGLINTLLIISSVVFGVLILAIYNLYETHQHKKLAENNQNNSK